MGDVRRPNTSDKTAITERRRKVAALALACTTQREIARTLDVAVGTVCGDLQALRKEWREESLADVDALIAREAAALDDIEAKAATQFAQTHEPGWLMVRLKAKSQRMALLGLAKQRVELSGPGGGPIAVREIVVELPPLPLHADSELPAPGPVVPASDNGFLDVVMDLPQ